MLSYRPAPTSGPPGQENDTRSEEEIRESLKQSIAGDTRTPVERHAQAVKHATQAGGYATAIDYLEAMKLKETGRADAMTLARIDNTHPDITTLINRPG